MFFGFRGKDRLVVNRELTSLGMISYDFKCVEKERLRQGSVFSWGIPAEKELKVAE